MATIFGIIVVATPIVLVVANIDRIINFVETFINFHK